MAEGGPLVNEEGRSSDRLSEATWVENDGDQDGTNALDLGADPPRHHDQEATVNLEFSWFADAINRVHSVREVGERCVMLVSRRSWTTSGASGNGTWVSYVHINHRVPLRDSCCASSSLMALRGYYDLYAKTCARSLTLTSRLQ